MDGEFLVGDYEGSSSEDLELVVDKAVNKAEEKEEVETQNILDYDIEGFTDRPWNKPGADITDYFNYGFNETTWKEYCNMQKRKSETTGSEWTKYSGVRRGFNEIKREDEGKKDRRFEGKREWNRRDDREERRGRRRDKDDGEGRGRNEHDRRRRDR